MPSNDDLLPGVTTRSCPPRVVCDARGAIRSARLRARLRELFQISLLLGIDYLFVHWPESRMPFLDRRDSLDLLRVMNGVIIIELWLTHALPKLWAKRIAETWSRGERAKFKVS